MARNRNHSYHGYPNFMRDRWAYWHHPRDELFDEDDDMDVDTDEHMHRAELDAAARYESWVADAIASFEEVEKRFEEEEELLDDHIFEEETNDVFRSIYEHIPDDDDEGLTADLASGYYNEEERLSEEEYVNLIEHEMNDMSSTNESEYDGHIPDDDDQELTANLVRDYYENLRPGEPGELEESDGGEDFEEYSGHIPDDDEEAYISESIEAFQYDQWRQGNAHQNIPNGVVENLMGDFAEEYEYDRNLLNARRQVSVARGESRSLKSALDNKTRALSNSRRTCSRYRAERDNARNVLAQTQASLTATILSRQQMRVQRDMARTNLSSVARECQRLQSERDGAMYRIDELCTDDLLSSKDLDDINSLEKKMKLALDRVAKKKESLVKSLSEEAEKRLCVICQEEQKSVLLL